MMFDLSRFSRFATNRTAGQQAAVDRANRDWVGSLAQELIGEGRLTGYDDPRLAMAMGALQRALNGEDIPDKDAFIQNLGLGPGAKLSVGAPGGLALYDDERFGGAGGGGTGTSGRKSIKDYGAKMNGVDDDGPAAQAMFNDLGEIYIPQGDYYSNQRVGSLALNGGRGVRITGDGVGRTRVRLGANGGFDVTGDGFLVQGLDIKPAPGAIVVNAVKVGNGTQKCDDGLVRGNRFSANDGNSYIALHVYMQNVWYSRIEDNGFYGADFKGNCCRFRYCLNITTTGNYALYNELGYWWEETTANTGFGVYRCEGHMISGNTFAVNKYHFRFNQGLYPVLQNNIIDLCKTDGCPIETQAFLTSVTGNWFATMLGGTNEDLGAPLIFNDSDCHIVANNNWAGNDRLGIAMTFRNCNFSHFVNNNIRFYKNALTASGCDELRVAFNTFVGYKNVAADLAQNTNLKWYGNTMRGDAGSYGLGAVLPAGVYDPLDNTQLTAKINAVIDARGGGSAVAPSFSTSVVFTTPGSSALQFFNVYYPGGRFSSKPVAVANLGGSLGFGLICSVDYDNSTTDYARVTFRRTDNANIDGGQAYRFVLIARQQD